MNLKPALTQKLGDVRLIIGFFFLLHLSTITLPPLEPGSTWRQTDGLMIARNFYEHSANLLYPTVDVEGERSGVVGCEFPLLNYLIYLISVPFGFHSWYGRLINLIISSIGAFFFYKLIDKHFGKAPAYNSTVILLASIWFTYNRTNIPDTFALSMCLISLYSAIVYLENGRIGNLLLFFLLGLLGCLSKISSASILTVLTVPFVLTPNQWNRKIVLSCFAILILAGVCVWYFYWVPYVNAKFGFGDHFFMGMNFSDGLNHLLSDLPLTLKRFYDTPFKYIGFALFLGSLIYVIRKKQWLHFSIFIIPFVVYLVIVVKIAIGLHMDAYYVIMFIPPMAFIMGWGLSNLNIKYLSVIILVAIVIEGVGNQIHVFEIRQPFKSLASLEPIIDQVSNRTDLIAMNGTGPYDPTPMYFAHRRGWVTSSEQLSDPAYLNDIKSKGCKFVVVSKKLYGELTLSYPKLHDSEYFAIYDLR